MAEPNMRLLSRIYNKTYWEFWQGLCWKVGDIGIPEVVDMEQYYRQFNRFPRCIPHAIGDWCERHDIARHTEWANEPMGTWPRNRKVPKSQHPARRKP